MGKVTQLHDKVSNNEHIVSMVEHQGEIYVATSRRIYKMTPGLGKKLIAELSGETGMLVYCE